MKTKRKSWDVRAAYARRYPNGGGAVVLRLKAIIARRAQLVAKP